MCQLLPVRSEEETFVVPPVTVVDVNPVIRDKWFRYFIQKQNGLSWVA